MTSAPAQPKPDPAVRPAVAAPVAVVDAQVSALQAVMRTEEAIRKIVSTQELGFLAVNDVRRMVQGRQAFLLVRKGADWETVAVSSLARVDRGVGAIGWVESIARRLAAESDANAVQDFALPAFATDVPETAAYPFPYLLWQPLSGQDNRCFAALLMTRETPWAPSDKALARRLCETLGHSWRALVAPGAIDTRGAWTRLRRPAAAVLLLAVVAVLTLVQVPMSALAPAEIVARTPGFVTVPMDGVIADVQVEPGAVVRSGALLATLVDLTERGTFEIAEREVAVALANWRRLGQSAFSELQARRELLSAEAELALKQAERDYARERLSRTRILADRDGIAVFPDRRELIGRPVQTGQRLMEIADPARVHVRIQMPVEDAILIAPGTRVRLFLDSEPLRPLEAEVTRAAMSARPNEANALSFLLHASLVDAAAVPRLGTRGTAQLAGPPVALGFYLFRRPVSALRQKFGI